ICLITDDGTPATVELAGELSKQNWSVVVLSFPPYITLPNNNGAFAQHVLLEDMSEVHLQETLKRIVDQYGPIAAFIHLGAAPEQISSRFWSETEKAIAKHVFLIAKHLKPSLASAARLGRASFMVVGRLDGALGTTGSSAGIISGGLPGLVKTL